MKLRRELIDRIAHRMAGVLVDEELVAGLEEPALAGRIAQAVTEDLMVEDRAHAVSE